MHRKRITTGGLFAAVGMATVFFVSVPALATVSIKMTGKSTAETNPYPPDTQDWFNKRDCEDGALATFEVIVRDEDNTFDVYIYAGDSCNTSSCTLLKTLPRSSSGLWDDRFELSVEDIFGAGCTLDTTEKDIWAGLKENEDANADDVTSVWTENPVSTVADFMAPPAPTDVTAKFSDGGMTVSWDADGEDLTYTFGDGESSESDTDSSFELDFSVGGTRPGSFYVLYVPCGSADPGDTDTTVVVPFDPVGDLDDTDGDTSALSEGDCEEACDGVGFEPGDEIDSSYDFKTVAGANRSSKLSGLTNGENYKAAVVSFDAFNNPSPVSDWDCATPGATTSFFDSYTDAGGAGGGKFCFVATAAFGSYDHPTVRVLRRFRDEFLMGLWGGESLIQIYYAVGPSLASLMEGRPQLRTQVRSGLETTAEAADALRQWGPRPVNITLMMIALFALGAVAVQVHSRRRKNG